MSSEISNNLASIQVPLLIVMRDQPDAFTSMATIIRTRASPSHPALKNPFWSWSIERADTGPRWPFITWQSLPGSWRIVKRLICPAYRGISAVSVPVRFRGSVRAYISTSKAPQRIRVHCKTIYRGQRSLFLAWQCAIGSEFGVLPPESKLS